MSNIVEVNHLVKRYPGSDQPAVRDLSFAIRRGEIFGFLGPNGAGKTTTISMLSCLLKPSGGSATIAGFDLARRPHEIKRRIGVVLQDLALYPTLSANDHLLFYGRIYGLTGRQLAQRVSDALNMVGLYDRRHETVQKYSDGMKRRVNIAVELLHRPEILFLDEPTVGVDLQSRNFIFDNVKKLNQNGVTVLYTTHYMEEAERLCQRVAIIDQGKIVALDTPRALQEALGGGLIVVGLPEDVPDTLDHEIRALPGVRSVERFDHQLKVKANNAQQTLPDVINVFNRLNLNIHSLELLEPNLEAVFLELTGRRLRD